MRKRTKTAFQATVLMLITIASAAGGQEVDARLAAHNAEILGQTPGHAGALEVTATGEIHHLASGLVCPASFPTYAFWQGELTPENGGAGCDYGRGEKGPHATARLSIRAYKAGAASIDTTFKTAYAALQRAAPSAQYIGPAVEIAPGTIASPFGEFKSAEFGEKLDAVPYTEDLIVTVRAGWVIEVRATFPTGDNMSGAQDGAAPAIAFLSAVRTVH